MQGVEGMQPWKHCSLWLSGSPRGLVWCLSRRPLRAPCTLMTHGGCWGLRPAPQSPALVWAEPCSLSLSSRVRAPALSILVPSETCPVPAEALCSWGCGCARSPVSPSSVTQCCSFPPCSQHRKETSCTRRHMKRLGGSVNHHCICLVLVRWHPGAPIVRGCVLEQCQAANAQVRISSELENLMGGALGG